MFFESVPYFSSQSSITASESIPLLSPVQLHALALVPDVFSLVLPEETTTPLAPQSLKNFWYVYTHRQKNPASEPVPVDSSSPIEGPHSQLSAPPSDLDVPIALRKGKSSFTDHLISHFVFFDRLNLFSPICLFLLYLYPGHMRRLYWYLPGSRSWMRR